METVALCALDTLGNVICIETERYDLGRLVISEGVRFHVPIVVQPVESIDTLLLRNSPLPDSLVSY